MPKKKRLSNNKLHITVGIPAYNEEGGIVNLIESILSQKQENFILDTVLVVSDMSTDATVERIRELNNSNITIIERTTRDGKSEVMNDIFQRVSSDVVVIFDADISLSGKEVLSRLVEPFYKNNDTVLVFGAAIPNTPKTFVQKVAMTGWNMWYCLRSQKKDAEMYMCEGTVRAFRRSLYQKMRFPNSSADDVFPYLYCKRNNLNITFASDAIVKYSLPATYKDYISQNIRFLRSKKVQSEVFDEDFLKQYYVITSIDKIKVLILYFFKSPFYMAIYLLFILPIKVMYAMRWRQKNYSVWSIATSTKVQK